MVLWGFEINLGLYHGPMFMPNPDKMKTCGRIGLRRVIRKEDIVKGS